MKKLIELKLKWLARRIVKKYNPEIIGITGSVGKTSAKEAVFTVLAGKFRVRRSIKNYNNELGLPLTIIGAEAQGHNIFGWLAVFFKAISLLFVSDKDYPEILILEMGVDRPGDMDYLNTIVQPKIGILTFVGTVHVEYFKNREALKAEKAKLIEAIPPSGASIINYDNEDSRSVIGQSQARVISYGFHENAALRAQKVRFSYNGEEVANNLQGISFKLGYKGSLVPILVPGVAGINAVYAALAGAAAGLVKGLDLAAIAARLKDWQPARGRMRIIPGIKRTTIIDDSYNAEPASTLAALGALKRIPVAPGARRFALLGDMLELGRYSEAGHRDIGKYAAGSRIDKLIVVGERARDIARGALEAGMKNDDIFRFPDSVLAGRFVQDRMKEHDLILVKGSQGARMERIVLEIMAEPLRAGELLVRQDKQWAGR